MNQHLCRGWTQQLVIDAVQGASPLARRILRSMAQHPGITAEQIASDIGVKGMTTVAGSLSSWYQHVTRPLGVKDPETGEDSWPFRLEPPSNVGTKSWRYYMPPPVTEIVLRLTSSDS